MHDIYQIELVSLVSQKVTFMTLTLLVYDTFQIVDLFDLFYFYNCLNKCVFYFYQYNGAISVHSMSCECPGPGP